MKPRGALPILTYHAIEAGRGVTSTDPALFAETLDALLAAGFRAVDLGEWIEADRPPVDRGFALAFDDGLGSILNVAERLYQLAIPATVFLLSKRIGLDNAWPGQPSGMARRPLLDRSDLEALGQLGFRFGSHGRSHGRFDRMGDGQLEEELIRSRAEIEQGLGCRCPLLAYPYGANDARVRLAVSKAYDAAFGTRLAYATSADDRFDIARVDAYYLRSPGAVERLVSGRWRARLAVRRALRSVREAVERVAPGFGRAGHPARDRDSSTWFVSRRA